MQLSTTRFGLLAVDVDDLIHFPHGVIGYEGCRRWLLLADPQSDAVGWLQSAERPATALAVVSPRRFAAGYRIRVARHQLACLALHDHDRMYALCVVNKQDGQCVINLRAPILINLDRRLGCQLITSDEQPLQLPLTEPVTWRKSA
ncbi:MAG: flagellar assembly protein FliW [Pirellulaceae bacterium]|jgi:flagellar assembly factor FliW|nr:flagellar assembly protein FliW [Pirellulaceae bacterium]